MMDVAARFNFFEALLWFSLSGLFLFFGGKTRYLAARQRKNSIFLGITLFLFGITDLIEMQTGAWWKPVWLLVCKGICVIAIIFGYVGILRKRK